MDHCLASSSPLLFYVRDVIIWLNMINIWIVHYIIIICYPYILHQSYPHHYHICVGVSKFHHLKIAGKKKKKTVFPRLATDYAWFISLRFYFKAHLPISFPFSTFPNSSEEFTPTFLDENGRRSSRQVQTYGPDVDLALVKIHESVEDEFWAPWKKPRSREVFGLIGSCHCKSWFRKFKNWLYNITSEDSYWSQTDGKYS